MRDNKPPMCVAFRTDASIQIGTGHVMRCLTLADALAEQGTECIFISRVHEGHLNRLIAARGHQVAALPTAEVSVDNQKDESPAHALWLGTGWAQDVDQTLQALGEMVVDWLVVDHYALDARWETALRPVCGKLMVIDDLADRNHDCDLLLDQNLGRKRTDYLDLIRPECSLLAGPEYALLRPEFADLRDESLARRIGGTFQHLLITLGGVDKDNVTGKVLDALVANSDHLPANLGISVILGPYAPWRDEVQKQAERLPWPTQVAVGLSDMARRMADADLAIGAGGSTSWERCCLGLPTLVLVIAHNQLPAVRALDTFGAAIDLGMTGDGFSGRLSSALQAIQSPNVLDRISKRAAAVCDGLGTQRILAMMEQGIVNE